MKPMSEPVDPWQEYRRRRKLALFAFFGYLPAVFGTAVPADRLLHAPGAPILVMVGWLNRDASTAGFRNMRHRCQMRCSRVMVSDRS